VHASRRKVLIFDFDYTLFDTSAGVVECMRRALSAFGRNVPDEAAIRATIGLPLAEAISSLDDALPHTDVDAIAERFIEFSGRYMVELTVPIPPVPSLLPELVNAGFRLAVFTGKYRARVVGTLHKHGLLECFDLLVCGDEVRGKPDPEGIERIREHWKEYRDEEFVLIGDHYLDILAARNADIDCIAVCSGRTPRQVLECHTPLAVIPDLNGLRAALSEPVVAPG
jgi:phosphoglycolate phosphatase